MEVNSSSFWSKKKIKKKNKNKNKNKNKIIINKIK